MLTNSFTHNQHITSSSSNAVNAASGNKKPPTDEGDHLCVNMVKSHINVATISYDYSSSQTVLVPESPPPSETPL
jgi:hypothetical protein